MKALYNHTSSRKVIYYSLLSSHLLVLLYWVSRSQDKGRARLTNMLDGIVSRELRLHSGELLFIHIDDHKRHDYGSANFFHASIGDILEECLLLSLTIFAPLASSSLTALFLSSSEVLFWKDTITTRQYFCPLDDFFSCTVFTGCHD
jgi:hypothetical protein